MPKDAVEFSENMPEWSKWKHEILLGYLGAFAGILQKFQTVYFVDGFAGAAKYDDGSESSALRTAKLADSIESNPSRKYKLRCINVEQNRSVFKKLEQNTSEFSTFVTNYQGSFNSNVGKILGKIGDQPTLFFLDPFGVKGLDWDKLKYVFARQPSGNLNIITELLIRYDVQAVARVAGFVGKTDDVAQKNVKVLLSIFGLDTIDQWYELISETGSDIEGLTKAYEQRLREYFDHVVKMPIKKSGTDQLKYYLIFATRNPKAIAAMNDVLYKVENIRDQLETEKEFKSTGQMSMFDDVKDDFVLNELSALKKRVLDVLEVEKSLSRANLVTQVSMTENSFGYFSSSHFTAVLGGRTRNLQIPKEFESLKGQISLSGGTASNDKTIIKLVS